MKQEQLLLLKFLTMFVLFFVPQSTFAYDQYESMNVGETKTFYFPTEVTNRASAMYAYNCSSDHINQVEVVSYTNTSVTVKAIEYTSSQVNIRFDYWWYENNYGRHDTHMVHIDLNGGGGGGNTGSDYNPYNYDLDYGCWGTINVDEGSTTTIYCQYDIPIPSKVKSILWSNYQQISYEITSQSSSSCTIKGRVASSGGKLWCLMKYGNTSYKAYYTVNVNAKPTLSLSANPDGGKVDKGKIVYLTASNTSADIYYTLNGSTPTTNSMKYTSSGITINEDCTLKAVAKKSGYNDSPVMTWIYTVEDTSPIIAEINVTNFPDENFCNYLLEQDYGKDGKLTETEINGISKINVQRKNISSLKGIEYFTALTSLSCSSNQLTTLDVSKNTKLTSLDCSYNQIVSLLIPSNAPSLTWLSCQRNRINGSAMDDLISKLPQNTTGEKKTFQVVDTRFLDRTVGAWDFIIEENVCNNCQIELLKAKGWTPMKEYSNVELEVIDVTEITLNKPSLEVKEGNEILIYPTFKPNEATYKRVVWESSDPNVVTIESIITCNHYTGYVEVYGEVKTHTEGTATITCTTIDCSGVQATCTVTVEADLDGISTVMMDEKSGIPIYTLSGQRLTSPRKGINIIGGKKIVIK